MADYERNDDEMEEQEEEEQVYEQGGEENEYDEEGETVGPAASDEEDDDQVNNDEMDDAPTIKKSIQQSKKPSLKKKKKQMDDDEDDDDEEDDGKKKKRKTKHKKNKSLSFLDIEAEVDEEDEDEEETGVDNEFINDVEDVANESIQASTARARPLPMRKDTSVEEYLLHVKERFGDDNEIVGEEDEEEVVEGGQVDSLRQQQNYPTIKDPKLFMVKCKLGTEKEVIFNIMQKYLDSQATEQPLLIKSAISIDALKGYVYIEAYKDFHVKQAIDGIPNVNIMKVKLVPIKEMTEVLRGHQKSSIQSNSWVRVKRGLYKDDLAQVYHVEESRGICTIKLVPREDFFSNEGENKRKRSIRAPQKFFNPEEVTDNENRPESKYDSRFSETFIHFKGNRYKDGYLIKTIKISNLDTKNIVPSLDEVQKFHSNILGSEDIAKASLTAQAFLGVRRKVFFKKGDTVKIIEGEQKGTVGTVVSIAQDENKQETVYIQLQNSKIREPVPLYSTQLQKHFGVGTHCKVISGKYEGETGMVVRTNDNTVILYSDTTNKEMEVFSQDVQEISKSSVGLESISGWALHDLVKLTPETVGVIVKVEKDAFIVLDNKGVTSTITLSDMNKNKKLQNKNMTALDKNNNQINANDSVRIINGVHKGKQAVVKHIFRSLLFCHARDVLENSGIFVTRAKDAESRASRNPQQKGKPVTGNYSRPPTVFGSYKAGKSANSQFMHKTVRIVKGVYKGYIGIVVGTTDTYIRVELHSMCKTLNVKPEEIKEIPALTQSSGNEGGMQMNRYQPSFYDARTPLRDGSETPLHDSSRTPSSDPWNAKYTNTPVRETPSYYEDTDYPATTPAVSGASPSFAYSPVQDIHNPTTPGNALVDQHVHSPIATPTNYTTPSMESPGTPSVGTPSMESPGTPSVGTPQFNEMQAQQPQDDQDILGVGLEVNVKHNYDSEMSHHLAVISGFNQENTHCFLIFKVGGEYDWNTTDLVQVPKDAIEVIAPAKKDQVMVLRGVHKGKVGELFGVDAKDGIVKTPDGIIIVRQTDLAKHVGH